MTLKPKWVICGLLTLATIISYIDRQAFAVVAPVIAKEFNFNNQDIALMGGAFILAYAFGQMVSGKVIDILGSRRGFSLSITVWSAVQAATATANGVFGFTFWRFLLGVGESGNFPGGIKVLSKWFSAEERSFAMGIFSSGGSMGAIIAPPIIAFIMIHFGWRPVFVLTAVIGFLWLTAWLIIYRPQGIAGTEADGAPNRRVAHDSRETFLSAEPEDSERFKPRWIDLFKYRAILGVTLGRFFEEPMPWFYFTWLPKYLVEYRHFQIMEMGITVTIPFITLDVGYIAGGWISSLIIKRGFSLSVARKSGMVSGCGLMMCSIPAPFVESAAMFVALVSIATMGHGLWVANSVTVPADLVPERLVGSVYGITATGGGIGGFIFMQLTGIVADRTHSFDSIFIIIGLLPLIVALIVLFGMGKIEMLGNKEQAA